MTAMPDGAAEWREMPQTGFLSRLGPLQALRTAGGWRYGLATDDTHLNAIGLVHGGVITGLIDHAVALFGWEAAGRNPVVTVQCDTRFFTPARSGDFIEVAPALRHLGKGLIHLEADVTVGERAVARGNVVMKIARKTSGERHD